MDNTEKQKSPGEKVESSPGSILFSLLLVACAMGFVFGFKYFLASRSYTGPAVGGIDEEIEESSPAGKITMETDSTFKYQYIMIQGLGGIKLQTYKSPEAAIASGKSDVSSQDTSGSSNDTRQTSQQSQKENSSGMKIEEGQILQVKKRGYIDGKLYYLLDNGLYLKDSKSIIPLKENIKMSGYVTITYISSSGVRLRKWADFDADNVAASVYVGDKVNIRGKVTTVTDTSAFVTSDGLYMTTDNRYLNDHTNVVESSTKTGKNQSTQEEDPGADTKSPD